MSGETILIVEDNAILRLGILEILELEGYHVLEARHGGEAIEILKNNSPDLILSDVMMPEVNGFDLYSYVRGLPELFSVPFILLTARAEPADFTKGRLLGVDDYLAKPVTREELVTAIQSRLMRYSQVKLAQLVLAYQTSLTTLANAIESRVPGSSGFIEWLVQLSQILANCLEMNEHATSQLRFGTILHDIGKLNVPEDILFKKEPLNEQDWASIRSHASSGAEMVRGVEFLSEVVPLIRHHHERWDGNGYPDSLSGTDIPAGARIIAVIDSFEAMISPRVYAPQLTPQEAYHEILRNSGTQFDPTVVECFKHSWENGSIHQIIKDLTSVE